jgi:hypothetical protein
VHTRDKPLGQDIDLDWVEAHAIPEPLNAPRQPITEVVTPLFIQVVVAQFMIVLSGSVTFLICSSPLPHLHSSTHSTRRT